MRAPEYTGVQWRKPDLARTFLMNEGMNMSNEKECTTHHICDCLESKMEYLTQDNNRLREWLKRISEWHVVWSGKVLPIKSIRRMAKDALEGK